MPHRRQNPFFRKILVGYDGSELSEKAVDVALSMSTCIDAKIMILAVARPPEPATRVELDAVLDDAREHFEQGFVKVRERAANAETEVETFIEVGHPAEHLIHKAETEHVDLIVVGRRGTSLVAKMMLGSISERVLRYAHCPVLLVK